MALHLGSNRFPSGEMRKTSTGDRTSEPPVRFACLFSGNGYHSKEWWAKGEGPEMQLGKVSRRSSRIARKLLFLRGLYNHEAMIGGIHSCQTGNLLTGAHLAPGGEIKSGVSCDQVVAEQLKGQTKVPSLVLGCEPSIAAIHKNYSMIYSSHISWNSATTPPPTRAVSGRWPSTGCSRDEVGRARQERPRCGHRIDAAAWRSSASQSDRRRLDEYLSSVRTRSSGGSSSRARRGGCKTGEADSRQARHGAARRRHPAGHRSAHAADVRHHGAGLPDRHLAALHLEAEHLTHCRSASRT